MTEVEIPKVNISIAPKEEECSDCLEPMSKCKCCDDCGYNPCACCGECNALPDTCNCVTEEED